MPKRRTRRPKPKKSPRLIFYLILFLFLLAVLFFVLLKISFWDGKSKFGLVVAKGENVEVVVFNPRGETLTTIAIPGETQVLVAGGLGSWKLKSVWQLGINEKKGGDLLAKTIAKNFGLPVFAWADKTFIFPRKTNLTVGDRLKIALFSLRVGRESRASINLADYSEFLKAKTLLDGSKGYLLSGRIPAKIAVLLTDEALAGKNFKAGLVDKTSGPDPTAFVSRIIETAGIKVASIARDEPENFGCVVRAKNKKLAAYFLRIFSCRPGNWLKEGNFDLELELGQGFGKTF
jgi:hypothetical protein